VATTCGPQPARRHLPYDDPGGDPALARAPGRSHARRGAARDGRGRPGLRTRSLRV